MRDKTPFHQFLVDISPKDAAATCCPRSRRRVRKPPGSADKRVQAYNYRMCFSDVPENRRAFRPAQYDAGRYALLARLIAALVAEGPPHAAGAAS